MSLRFQFQNGAIKSMNECSLVHLGAEFQFQNGAIKSFGGGANRVTSGTLQISSNQTLNTLNLNGGAVNIASGAILTVTTLNCTGGSFTGSGTLVATDMNLTSGTVSMGANIIQNITNLNCNGGTFSSNPLTITNMTVNSALSMPQTLQLMAILL
jgi:hypothetical protein